MSATGATSKALSEQMHQLVSRRWYSLDMPRRRKPPSPFRYFNSSPEMIRLVVLMYVRWYCRRIALRADRTVANGIFSGSAVRSWDCQCCGLAWSVFEPVDVCLLMGRSAEQKLAFDRAGAVALTAPNESINLAVRSAMPQRRA